LTANVYVGFVTSNGVCCDESAFEQRMRVPLQNVPVLESPGFAFVRVDDQILWLWRLLGDKGPFLPGWKSGSAQPTQIGLGNLVDHLLRRHRREGHSRGEISAARDVAFEPRAVRIFEPRREHRSV